VIFTDRIQAGTLLAEKLSSYRASGAIVVGLARGGMVAGAAVARALTLPLEVLVVKKIGSPFESELAIGAVAPDGISVIDWRMGHRAGADEEYIKTQTAQLSGQIKQKVLLYRKDRKFLSLKDKTVILVDDGAATGITMEVAIKWVRTKGAKKIVVALPVAPPDTVAKIKPEVAEVVALDTPENLGSVGQFYQEFGQVEDAEVVELLKDSKS